MDRLEYKIGRFTLKPHRQLLDAGVPVPIGRKALDLLSVLAKAEGALVTKDELMAAVWPKAIVEDNAIQVHIAALRKALGEDAELLSTVHGLGYRLATIPEASPTGPKSETPAQTAAASSRRRLARRIVPAALSVVAIAAASLWLVRDHLPWAPVLRESRVAVLPFDTVGPGKELRGLADSLADEIVSQLSDKQIQTVSTAQSKALRGGDAEAIDRLGADMVLDGTVQGNGKALDVRVHLDDVREHLVLWSGEFHGSADAVEALEARVAEQAAEVLYSARAGRFGKVRLDAASLAALIAARESIIAVRNGSFDAAEADFRKLVAASPDFSWGHSGVAAMEVFELREEPARQGGDALRADARLEAKRALALDPHNGEAWMALEYLAPLFDWRGREALLIQGIAADPSFEPIVLLEGRLLWFVGRGRDALPWFRRAHAVDPLRVGDSRTLALGLASEGRLAESQAVVAQMEVQRPEHPQTRDARFWTHVIAGATDDALTEAGEHAARPKESNQTSVDAWRAALKASALNDAAARTDAVKEVTNAATAGSLSHGEALTLLAMLGDLDGAFAQAELYEPVDPSAPPYLFLPMTAAMRSDPRFMPLARKLGLVAYWRSTGKWPDFCSEPGLPYDCRREAVKIAALRPPSKPMIGAGP
jgi:DNA-binding winged helix-turn-helix (wHTH) protein/TolB-like protein